MKRFTLILVGMLFLTIGGVSAQTALPLSGQNIQVENGSVVKFNHNTVNGKWNGLGGESWAASLNSGHEHRFTITLNGNNTFPAGFWFYATTIEDWNNDNSKIVKCEEITSGVNLYTFVVNETYGAVFLINIGNPRGTQLDIASITRTDVVSSSVNAPTISAPSTYDGDATVTITANSNTHHVNWTISENDVQFDNGSFTAAQSPFEYNVTGKTAL